MSICDHRWIKKQRTWQCAECEHEITEQHYQTLDKLAAANELNKKYREALEKIAKYSLGKDRDWCKTVASEALKEEV